MNEKDSLHSMLDELVSENHIQMIKTAIPYISVPTQKFAAIYAKALELNNTISFFNNAGSDLSACSLSADGTALDMLNDIQDYCNDNEKEMVDLMINFLNSFQLYNSYKAEFGQVAETNNNPMGLLKTFLSPEQQTMFETYNLLLNT